MTTLETAKEALNILEAHDFYYMLVDYGYESARANAKESMRHYVEVTDQLPSNMREAFRNLWIAEYEYSRCFRPMSTSPDEGIKEAKAKEARAICDQLIAELAA